MYMVLFLNITSLCFSISGESCDLINQINPHYKSSPKWQFLWVVKNQPEVIGLLFVVPYHINDISFEKMITMMVNKTNDSGLTIINVVSLTSGFDIKPHVSQQWFDSQCGLWKRLWKRLLI